MNEKSISYSQNHSNSSYQGIVFNQEYAENYLKTKVSSKYYDLEGTASLVKDFSSMDETGFSKEILEEILSINPDLKDWKIGECIAECYLEDDHKVRFHYASSSDAKNPEGNLHGADIVGFSELNDETVFVFGEVKTSKDKKSPPGVLYGSSGMIYQLEKIKNDDTIKESLVRWLAVKISDKNDDDPFRIDVKNATRTYLNSDKKKLKLVGVLIRDTVSNPNDLKSGYEQFIQNMNPAMFLNLSAIYFPISINDFGKFIQKEEN